MDTQKFGLFIAGIRKEKHMTQAELADKIQVTDKAVSRWERGLGFPDINTLEPLAEALEITVLELMRSEKMTEATVTNEEATEALITSFDVAKTQRKQMFRKAIKKVILSLVAIAAVICLWLFITGLVPKTSVYLADYSVMEDHNAITILVGNTSSMGYIRGMSNVSKQSNKMELQFYSAFGGLNSSLGAQNVFILSPKEDCTEIYFKKGDGFKLVLQKNTVTGEWERVIN